MAELIALARAKPDALNFASNGPFTIQSMQMLLLMHNTGIKLNHVPYKGGGEAVTGVMSNAVQLYFAGVSTAIELIRQGKLTALGVGSAKRSPVAPEIPAIAETGGDLADFDAANFTGVLLPAGAPKEIVDKMNRDISEAVKDPEITKKLNAIGFVVVASSPEAFAEKIRSDLARWTALVKEVGWK
jgi:tripartite-type tricarboxylate transporter receptor subunit TctC